MRTNARFLLMAARFCSIGAVVLGLAVGFIEAASGRFVCFDSCPTPER